MEMACDDDGHGRAMAMGMGVMTMGMGERMDRCLVDLEDGVQRDLEVRELLLQLADAVEVGEQAACHSLMAHNQHVALLENVTISILQHFHPHPIMRVTLCHACHPLSPFVTLYHSPSCAPARLFWARAVARRQHTTPPVGSGCSTCLGLAPQTSLGNFPVGR